MQRPVRLILVLLALAGAAEAQQTRRTPAGGASSLGLRGAITPEDASAQAGTAAALRTPGREPVIYGAQGVIQPLTAAAQGVGGVAQQCRLSCAQTYYFCLASSQADDCSTSWSQCRAGCNSDPLTSSY